MIGIGQKDLADLRDVGLGVSVDLFAAEHFSGLVAASRIADAGGVVADDENRFVSPILELPNDLQRHSVTERHIRRGRVHPELDPQRLAGFSGARQLSPQILLGQHSLTAAAQKSNLLVNRRIHK